MKLRIGNVELDNNLILALRICPSGSCAGSRAVDFLSLRW